VEQQHGSGATRTPEGGDKSEELNLSSNLLSDAELDVEGHMKKERAAEEPEDDGDDEVEAHLLDNNLLLDNNNLLDL
jgi:hypothetical protein